MNEILKTYNFTLHGIDWELNIVENDGSFEGVGNCDYCSYTVNIIEGLTKSQFKSVLLHEITHAIRWTYGLVSEMELANIPWGEVEEIVANTVEAFGEEIIDCVTYLMSIIYKNKKESK